MSGKKYGEKDWMKKEGRTQKYGEKLDGGEKVWREERKKGKDNREKKIEGRKKG